MPQVKGRDLELTRKQLTAWLASRHAGGPSLEVEGLKGPSDTGFSSDTLMFDVTWDTAGGGRESLVARLKPQGFCVFPEYDVARQYDVMKSLAATDVPVPRMRWLEEDPEPLGVPFYVMDRVDGRVPTDTPPYNIGGWVHDLAPDDQARLWWNGLEAMTRIHKLDWKALGFDYLAEPERGDTLVAQHIDYYESFVDWGMERERYPLIRKALEFLHGNPPKDEPTAICWGDARMANQIFDGLDVAAVIDWEMVRLGNPVDDLAWWISVDRCFSDGIGVERLSGLPRREETVARWEELTGRTADHLDYYEVFALLRFSVVMVRMGLQMKHYAILPEDHTMDRDNLASLTLSLKLGELGL